MLDILLAPETLPFSVAIGVVFIIAALEGVGLLLGFAFSGLLENLMPDLDVPDVDAPDMADHGAFGEFLTWLRIREVPVIIILIAFLTSFAITGFIGQQISSALLGFMWPGWIASLGAVLLCLPGVRMFAGLFSKLMPKDETEAIGTDSFVGRTVMVTLGTASSGNPAQAKFKDKYGLDHYMMVEPDIQSEVFEQGENILLVRKEKNVFFGVAPDKI